MRPPEQTQHPRIALTTFSGGAGITSTLMGHRSPGQSGETPCLPGAILRTRSGACVV
jgi:hypothetical protein